MAFTVDILTIKEAATHKAVNTSARTIEAVQTAAADTTIILDFDETLFLRNSTAEYLNMLGPRPLGAAYLLAIEVIRPWRWLNRWTAKDISADWFTVVLATLLFPWTWLVWRAKAKSMAAAYWNQDLMAAIAQNPNANVVVTGGFSWIVNPLLQHLPDGVTRKIARGPVSTRFWQCFTDSVDSKLQKFTHTLGKSALSRAVFVTADSEDALLKKVKQSYAIRWPKAKHRPAMSDVYVPLVYSERIKNPNKSHIMKRVIAGHWAFLAIAFSFLSTHFVMSAAALLLLTLSYWCVYEIGYWENDVIGREHESKPKLSDAFKAYDNELKLDNGMPWCWAIGLAAPALVLLEASALALPALDAIEVAASDWQMLVLKGALWICFLVAVRVTFWAYNQFNEEARIWIYPFLQTQKLFGFALLASTNAIGSILLLSLVVSRWLHYTIYRCGGDRDRFPLNTCCFVLYVLGFSAAAISGLDPAVLFSWQAGAAFFYCLVRGIKGFNNSPSPIYLVRDKSVPPTAATEVERESEPQITLGTYKKQESETRTGD